MGRATLVVFFLLTLSLADVPISVFLYYSILSNPQAVYSLIFNAFTFVFAFVQLRPILGVGFGEGYDIAKLLYYPASMKKIVYAGLFGNFFDAITLLIVVPIGAILAGVYVILGTFAAALFALCAFLFVLHCFSFSQLLVVMLQGLARSRKSKDALTVISLFLMIAFVGATQLLPSMVANDSVRSGVYHAAWVLPSAYPSNALESAHVISILFVIALALAAYVPIPITIRLAENAFLEPNPRERKQDGGQSSSRMYLPFSREANAVFSREWLYLFRDPSRKMTFISPVLISFVLLINTSYVDLPELMLYMLAMGIPWAIVPQMGQNIFGLEGKSLWISLSTPCKRRAIFIGKNAVVFVIGLVMTAAFILTFCVFFSIFDQFVPSVLFSFGALLVFQGLGNALSVHFPMRVDLTGVKRKTVSPQSAMMYMVAGLGLIVPPMMLVTTPVMAGKLASIGLFGPRIWGFDYLQLTYIMLVPALAYCALVYKITLESARKKLDALEPELLEGCA